WLLYLKKFTIFFPHLWPKGNIKLQSIIVFCGLLLVVARVLNVLVPRQLGIVADELSGDVPASTTHIWLMVLLYVFYRFLQGNMGVIGALRAYLWIPVGQYTYRSLAVSSFQHVHSLSLDFHIAKKTGEVLSALDKGSAINGFLEQLAFNVLPVIVDLFVAIVYFFVQFDAYFALIVAMMTATYLYATVKITEWRTGIRRDMVNKSREEYAVKADSITNYETVKYFNAEAWEFNRYEEAVKTYQSAEWKVLGSLNVMNVTQNLIFALGLLATCLLSAYRVTYGQATVGSFVALLTYMAQLQGPLNFFGTLYRSLQSNLVNAERMLELFTQGASIKDKPDAKQMELQKGEVVFDNVHFAYDARKPALRGLSFVAKPGILALVGESGAGKTTILRTLFRFYDVQQGSILIDGQDIRDVRIKSLREQIGVVPQDTVLFNDTIMFNIRYAKPDATDEEVFEAARKAQIHDKIVDWPDGYNSKVGERGLRLSGGEKQRIAIARTILKNPRIILLDEATSALDTTTERQIQGALDELSRGRTTLVIAHRLSTIIGADLILCLKDGVVVEQGTHEELLRKAEENGGKGEYYDMWQKQIRAEKRMKRRQPDGDETETAETSDAEGTRE
ncbi:P-loop containing nucleoside triphosphate hydrolase protein, partial [Protomyces lactucae-debilis]